jgi:hypothetical protein
MDYRRIVYQVVAGAVVAVLASATQAITIYVDDDNCPGPGSGTPGDPYCSIQTALHNAVDTDEIVVAPGTYFEKINLLGKVVWLRSADGPEVTTIDAQQTGSVVRCVSGEGSDTVLSGFTIANGWANSGAGMRIDHSSPTVTDCTFSANTAETGGGMMTENGSALVIDTRFCENTPDHIWGPWDGDDNAFSLWCPPFYFHESAADEIAR